MFRAVGYQAFAPDVQRLHAIAISELQRGAFVPQEAVLLPTTPEAWRVLGHAGGGGERVCCHAPHGSGPAAEVCAASDLGLLQDFGRKAETGGEDGVAFNLHNDFVNDLIDGLAVWYQAPKNARKRGRHGCTHDEQRL